jgi:hypothetical protein
VSPPLVIIDVLEEDVVVLVEEDVVVLGEGSTSVVSRVSSRRVRAPKARVADEGYDVTVHHVESPSLVYLDDPDTVLAGTSEVSTLLVRVQTEWTVVRTVLGGTFQHVSPLGCPILSHSVSKGMVMGRFAVCVYPIFSPFSSGCSFVFSCSFVDYVGFFSCHSVSG